MAQHISFNIKEFRKVWRLFRGTEIRTNTRRVDENWPGTIMELKIVSLFIVNHQAPEPKATGTGRTGVCILIAKKLIIPIIYRDAQKTVRCFW